MTTMADKLRESNRLARMRQGAEVAEDITLPSNNEVHFWQVPLNEAEQQMGVMHAAKLDVLDNAGGIALRNRAASVSDVWHSLREPGKIDQHAFESIEDMTALLEPADIDYLIDGLSLLMEYASPAVDKMTDEDLSDLKNAFGETDWSGLTGRRWAAVKLTCQVLFPELLQAKLLGSSSTDSSTQTSASSEST